MFDCVRYRIIGVVGGLFIGLLCRSLRVTFRWPVGLDGIRDLKSTPCVFACWHGTFLPLMWRLGSVGGHAMISRSGDGEVIAQVASFLGWRPVRGSSSRGGSEALSEIFEKTRTVRRYHVALIVDGPRGPSHHCKFGAIHVARHRQIPILPLGVAMSNAWTFRSWDRFQIPKPFSKVVLVAGPLIHVPSDLDHEQGECFRRQLEQAINAAEHEAQLILAGKNRTSPAIELRQAA